ncbi:unnamed protein product [Somion occarium]|uniref:Uncharacterized protein n=1 Tax=Somion occarium TaxID=3059160 RepID=A0ABP1DNA2_9APHY
MTSPPFPGATSSIAVTVPTTSNHHTSGSNEVDKRPSCCDQDKVVLGRVEFGGQGSSENETSPAATDYNNVLAIIVSPGHDEGIRL